MRIIATIAALFLAAAAAMRAQPSVLAITGATVLDGNGGPPLANAVIVFRDGRIAAVGPRVSTQVPAGAQTIDGAGQFIVPGFVDTNVHLSLYGGMNDRYETLVRYHDRQQDIVLEAAQTDLTYGITTVRDSYGMLRPLVAVRDRIAAGGAIGPRILAAGNILGWSGPYSISFSLTRTGGLTLFQEQMNDEIALGGGEELMAMMTPTALARAIDAYLDKGPDFLKYGGTSHFSEPAFIGFSLEAQRTLVERAHARRKMVETHATSLEGLRLALEAGIDGIQHPEMLDGAEMPDDLIRRIVPKSIVCSMLVSTITGEAWEKHLKDRADAQKKQQEADEKSRRARTTFEERQRANELGLGLEMRRSNAQKLIKAGALVTVGTDSYWAAASELSRTPKPRNQDHGIGTIMAIEGLVELGMTPGQAIVAGTKNGAIAARGLAEFGTIEAGKRADIVLLSADPLADIHNIRKVANVIKDGKVIDRASLPQVRVLTRSMSSH